MTDSESAGSNTAFALLIGFSSDNLSLSSSNESDILIWLKSFQTGLCKSRHVFLTTQMTNDWFDSIILILNSFETGRF